MRAHITATANLIVNTGVDAEGKLIWEAARSSLVEFDSKIFLK
jgi:hypothetical protein